MKHTKRVKLCAALCAVIMMISLGITFFVNHGRFWNPFPG